MEFFKNVMPGQNSRFMLALICSKCYLKKIYYRTNFLLGEVTFKHKTPLLKSNYSPKNEFYRKRYAGTFMLAFTENPIQFQIRTSILLSISHI